MHESTGFFIGIRGLCVLGLVLQALLVLRMSERGRSNANPSRTMLRQHPLRYSLTLFVFGGR